MKTFQLKFMKNRSLVRWLQLLDEFEKNPTCTLNDLAKITKSSTRTVISDIASIRNYFSDSIEIHAAKVGYFFEELDHESYRRKKQAMVKDEPIFLIFESLFFNEVQSLMDWSLSLNLSEQSLLSYFKKIEIYLHPFNLRLKTNPVTFAGSEIDIRKFFCLFYYESDININTIFPSINVQEAIKEITTLLQAKQMQSSSFSYFAYVLYISIERSKRGLLAKPSSELYELIKKNNLLSQYQELQKIMQRHFNYELPKAEAVYIFTCIICRRKINNPSCEEFCRTYNYWPEIKQIVSDFYAENQGNSLDERKDFLWLESFFIVVKLRELLSLTMNINIDDLNQFVKEKFAKEYQKNYDFLFTHTLVKKLYSRKYLNDFCASLTMYMESIKEANWGSPRTIAVIFEGNEYVCEYAENIIRRYLGAYHTMYYPDSNELSHEYLKEKNIELLITNYSEYATEYLLDVESILLKPIPDASDWNRLLNKINTRILRLVVLDNN